MGTANFEQQAGALLRKSLTYQKRNYGSNICLLAAPIFFCGLLALLQQLTNTVLLARTDLRCGCQCLKCCRTYANGTQSCSRLESGYCDANQGLECLDEDMNNCGIRYSTAIQSVWCEVAQPSTWPPVTRIPRPRYFSPPAGPYKTTTVLDTGDAPAVATALTAATVPRLTVSPVDLPRLQHVFNNLTDANFTVFNGHLLSTIGLNVANVKRPTFQYYLDDAFLVTGNDLELDMLYVLQPGATCAQRNMSYTLAESRVTTYDAITGRNTTRTVRSYNYYDLSTFLLKYFTYDYPALPLLLTAAGVNLTAITNNPLLQSIRVGCVDVVPRNMSTVEAVDATLYCGWRNGYQWGPGQCDGKVSTQEMHSFPHALDWKNTTGPSGLDVDVWYNLTLPLSRDPTGMTYRLPALLNSAVRGWTRTQIPATPSMTNELLGLQSMPKPSTTLRLDFSSLLGPLFYTWVVQLLLPTMLQQLVYEKEKRLRLIMKMHGLGDAPYWLVTYAWNMALYIVYMILFMVFGSLVNLKFFRKNNVGIQIVFYLLFGQVLLAFTFFLSTLFTSSRTAVVAGYLYVLGTGLVGYLLLDPLMQANKWWMYLVEFIPAFSLYRGLFELGAYAFLGVYRNSPGLTWPKLHDPGNGMTTTWIIMAVEWPIFMLLAWYLEQVVPTGNGATRHPLFFINWMWRKKGHEHRYHQQQLQQQQELAKLGGEGGAYGAGFDGVARVLPQHKTLEVDAGEEPEDVRAERVRVSGLTDYSRHPIVCRGLAKSFPAFAGGSTKVAVRDLTLAVHEGECFGLLGPNGAGKTTSINMLTGLLDPSSGSAVVSGLDLEQDLKQIYRLMGVCPQHDLLWDQLSGREHLLFYGRLKGLRGQQLQDAVDAALKSVNLYHQGVGEKLSSKYSGGMKRRLSVAISFMGDPRVVYLDEPSTGLDPASRRMLWDVVKSSKAGRGIILTTHSMQEAENLCDRLGIFVDGQLVCLGEPRELSARFASYLVLSLTVGAPEQVPAACALVHSLSPNARQTYALGATLKFELPLKETSASAVFKAMHSSLPGGLNVLDWAVSNATLEEVFIRLARERGYASLD